MADRNHTPESRSSQKSYFTVLSHPVRQRGDFYSLTDLHEAAGGDPSLLPARYLETPLGKVWEAKKPRTEPDADHALVHEFEAESVFGRREVVLGYALWVGEGFALAVLRALGVRPRPGIPDWRPTTRYDLGYVRDLRWDETRPGDIAWWEFEGQGALTAEEAAGLGRDFFEQTRQLARSNPGDAEMALKYSLMRLMEGGFPGWGFRYCEMVFCEWLSRAAVAWMASSEIGALPLQQKK